MSFLLCISVPEITCVRNVSSAFGTPFGNLLNRGHFATSTYEFGEMSVVPHAALQELVSTHGYWAVAVIVGLESMGIPLPGETIWSSHRICCG
jgi:hypothetical protein